MVARHKNMVIWKNIELISSNVFDGILTLVPKQLYKLIDQIERATTSIGANFIEGYYSGSTKEFIKFLGYSRRSLAELEFWIEHCNKRRFIPSYLFPGTSDLLIKTGYLIDRLILSLKEKSNKSAS